MAIVRPNAIVQLDVAPTLSHAATEELRELIIQGELRGGEHVREQRVCDRLGMSRTPVRSALNNLSVEGYLVYRPNRGYFVREFALGEVREAWEIRSVLEGLASRRCAERGISAQEEATLARCVAQGDRLLGAGHFERQEAEEYRHMNVTFHETVLFACQIHALPAAVKGTQTIPLASDRILVWQDFDHLRRSHDDHRRVLEAIVAREGARAESLMREHVYYAGIFVTDHIARNGMPSLSDGNTVAIAD